MQTLFRCTPLLKALLVGLLCAVLLSSCAKQTAEAAPSFSQEQQQKPQAAEGLPPLSLITARSGLMFSAVAPAEDGFYHILPNPNGTGNVLYSDYQSKQTVFLSAQVSSRHDSSADESFLASCMGGAVPACDGKYLYIARLGTPDLARLYGKDGQALLLQMEPNGGNRAEFYLPGEVSLMLGSALASDQTALYAVLSRAQPEGAQSVLCKIEIVQQKVTVLWELPKGENYFILGAHQRYFILKSVTQMRASPYDADYARQMEQLSHKLFVYHLDTQEVTEIATWKQGECSEAIAENAIYLYHTAEGSLEKIDCETMQRSTLPPLVVSEAHRGMTPQLEQDVWDGALLFYLTDETRRARLSYDLSNGEVDVLTLAAHGMPLMLYAQTADSFLVKTGDVTVPFSSTSKDGTVIETQQNFPQYALIRKEDFWNNRAVYQNIEVVTTD